LDFQGKSIRNMAHLLKSCSNMVQSHVSLDLVFSFQKEYMCTLGSLGSRPSRGPRWFSSSYAVAKQNIQIPVVSRPRYIGEMPWRDASGIPAARLEIVGAAPHLGDHFNLWVNHPRIDTPQTSSSQAQPHAPQVGDILWARARELSSMDFFQFCSRWFPAQPAPSSKLQVKLGSRWAHEDMRTFKTKQEENSCQKRIQQAHLLVLQLPGSTPCKQRHDANRVFSASFGGRGA